MHRPLLQVVRFHKSAIPELKKELIELAIGLGALVFGGAAEELLPKFCGAGFPVLMMSAVYFARRRAIAVAFMFAAAAGAAEDALSALPFATSISFFCLAAAFARVAADEWCAYAFAYPLYEIWLGMWMANPQGGVFARFLVAIPAGAVTAAAVFCLLRAVERKGAVDEA